MEEVQNLVLQNDGPHMSELTQSAAYEPSLNPFMVASAGARHSRQQAKMMTAIKSPPFQRSIPWLNIMGAYMHFNSIEYAGVQHHFLGDYYVMSAHDSELKRLNRISRNKEASHGQPGHVHTDACRHNH